VNVRTELGGGEVSRLFKTGTKKGRFAQQKNLKTRERLPLQWKVTSGVRGTKSQQLKTPRRKLHPGYRRGEPRERDRKFGIDTQNPRV